MNQMSTIIFYSHYAASGDSMIIDIGDSMPSLPDARVGIGVLSVALPPGAQITLYRDVNYQNEVMTLVNPASKETLAIFDLVDGTAQFSRGGAIYCPPSIGTPGSFKSATAPSISGVDYSYCTYANPDLAAFLGGVEIYEDMSGINALTQFSTDQATFDSSYNDRTSSLLIPPGIHVTLYADSNYSGASGVFYSAGNSSSGMLTLCNLDGGKSFMKSQASSIKLSANTASSCSPNSRPSSRGNTGGAHSDAPAPPP